MCRPKRDSVATGRHVETIPSTSLLCGSGDSLQQHIIIRIPSFHYGTFHFFKWLFTNPSYFLKTFSSLSHVRLFSACVRGSMGAEKGNYTASDLGMTVGFGLGLRVGSRMTETREVSLVYECSVYCDRPPNGDQTLQSRSEPSQLATPSTCPTAQPPRVGDLPRQ